MTSRSEYLPGTIDFLAAQLQKAQLQAKADTMTADTWRSRGQSDWERPYRQGAADQGELAKALEERLKFLRRQERCHED